MWEFNDQGSIPYVPLLRAPYYVGLYKVPKLSTIMVENKVEAPARFPPTFLYTQSWEDPHADAPYLKLGPEDVVLTLTSGGCNSISKCLDGVKAVYSVDCNPAQNSLLELKRTAIRRLSYEDVWLMFGEGKHPNFERLFESELAPFMSQKAIKFWRSHRSALDTTRNLLNTLCYSHFQPLPLVPQLLLQDWAVLPWRHGQGRGGDAGSLQALPHHTDRQQDAGSQDDR